MQALPSIVRNWLTARYLEDPTPDVMPGKHGDSAPTSVIRFTELAEFLATVKIDLLPTLDEWADAGLIVDLRVDIVPSDNAGEVPHYISRLNLPPGSHRLVGIRKSVTVTVAQPLPEHHGAALTAASALDQLHAFRQTLFSFTQINNTTLLIAPTQSDFESIAAQCDDELATLDDLASQLRAGEAPSTIHTDDAERQEWWSGTLQVVDELRRECHDLFAWQKSVLPPLTLRVTDSPKYFDERQKVEPEASRRTFALLGRCRGLFQREQVIQEEHLAPLADNAAQAMLDTINVFVKCWNQIGRRRQETETIAQWVRLVGFAMNRLRGIDADAGFRVPGGDVEGWILELRIAANRLATAIYEVAKSPHIDRDNESLNDVVAERWEAVQEKGDLLVELVSAPPMTVPDNGTDEHLTKRDIERPQTKSTRRPTKRRGPYETGPLTDAQSNAVDTLAAHQGNLTKAAAAFGVSRTAFTNHIARAEKKLNQTLRRKKKKRPQRLPTDHRGNVTNEKVRQERKPMHSGSDSIGEKTDE